MRFFLFIFLFFSFNLFSQENDPLLVNIADRINQEIWVDSIYNKMSLDQKVGQLFMPMVFSRKDSTHYISSLKLIKKYHIGGVIFSLGSPYKQTKWLNSFQKNSKTPLLVGMDAEWGVSMRLDSVMSFPWNMTLGAIRDTSLIRKIGYRMGVQEKRLGVHISFSPVLDINTNPRNPIIGNRSFGESKKLVTNHGIALMQGHHQAGILTSGKHFPGHGDTAKDSHKTLPILRHSKKRINDIELYPYYKLIEKGISSVMIAHLNVPVLTSDKNPTSLSSDLINNLLKQKMGFKGLIITDALNMDGVFKNSKSKNVDLQAFLAGNDLLIVSRDTPKGFKAIKKSYKKGIISEKRLSHSVKKILKAKYKAGLYNYKPIKLNDITKELNSKEDSILNYKAIKKSLTLLKNKDNLLPLKLDERIAHISLGDASSNVYRNELSKKYKIKTLEKVDSNNYEIKIKDYDKIIISFHRSNKTPYKSEKMNKSEIDLIKKISDKKSVILNLFVKPYVLKGIEDLNNISSILLSYQNSNIAQKISVNALFGFQKITGRLPVTGSKDFVFNSGIDLLPVNHLKYSNPAVVGFNEKKLNRLDSLAKIAIDSMMTPGIQMLVARKGRIVYHKSHGFHTYKKRISVKNDHVYDIASLTKIIGTLPLVIKSVDNLDFHLNSTLKDILPEFKGSNKENITIKNMLSHFSYFTPWIPFYKETINKRNKPKRKFYRKNKNNKFSILVSENLYMRNSYKDKMFEKIVKSPILKNSESRYSDLPFYILKYYYEKKFNKDLSLIVQDQVINPLSLKNTSYFPLKNKNKAKIVPSEIDHYYRNSELKGYVHDMGAAMQGGDGGHAGLFSNAFDIAVVMQMYLQGGVYDNKKILSKRNIDSFNYCYFCNEGNRRGVGFDKPQINSFDSGPTFGGASNKSFGHLGFTGTYTWADPENEIIVVFLSNRTYPSMERNLIAKHDIRTRMQQIVYEALTEK